MKLFESSLKAATLRFTTNSIVAWCCSFRKKSRGEKSNQEHPVKQVQAQGERRRMNRNGITKADQDRLIHHGNSGNEGGQGN